MITIGRIVRYVLTEQDAEAINRRRTNGAMIAKGLAEGTWPAGAQAHVGNPVSAGENYPLIVTHAWEHDSLMINGQVFLDGTDSLWVTSVKEGTEPGTWHWPPKA